MNTGHAEYVTPKDRTTSEILREMRSMGLPDLSALLHYAQQLNTARNEHEARIHDLTYTYDFTPESHAE